MTFPYIIKQDSVTMFIKGSGRTVASDHVNFSKIVAALEAGCDSAEEMMTLIDVVKAIGAVRETPQVANESNRDVVFDVASGTLKYRGYPLSGYIANKATELYKAGSEKPLQRFLAFLENLYKNPRSSIAERLYRFLEVGNMPITEDGHFLAYKKIRNDWKDHHTGTMDNSVGKVIEMPRVLVNDKDTDTCASGLHFCSYSYLGGFGGSDSRIVVMKINPADVVSIPVDYNDTKGRCCKYEVLSEITDAAKQGPVLSKGPAVLPATAYRAEVVEQDEDEGEHIGDEFIEVVEDETPYQFPTAKPQQGPVTVQVSTSSPIEVTLNKLSKKQLVEIWNKMAIRPIDHFRDKPSGVKRLLALTDRPTLERLAAQLA
jgi:hypothetical protein